MKNLLILFCIFLLWSCQKIYESDYIVVDVKKLPSGYYEVYIDNPNFILGKFFYTYNEYKKGDRLKLIKIEEK